MKQRIKDILDEWRFIKHTIERVESNDYFANLDGNFTSSGYNNYMIEEDWTNEELAELITKELKNE